MGDVAELWVGSGGLNALVIKDGTNSDRGTLIQAIVETPGSVPGPAEKTLHSVQDRALAIEIRSASRAGKTACSSFEGAITSKTTRVGDGGHAVQVEFACSAGEACCKLGPLAATEALHQQVNGAQAAVTMNPLQPFH